MRNAWLLFFTAVSTLLSGEYYYIQGGEKVFLTPLSTAQKADLRSKDQTLSFADPQGRRVDIPNRIIVKTEDPKRLEEYIQKYGIEKIRCYSNGTCILKAATPIAALEAANALSLEADILYAQPDLIRTRSLR